MRQIKWWHVVGIVSLTLVSYWLAARFLGLGAPATIITWVLGAWLLVFAIMWAARTLDPHVWIYTGCVILVALFLPPQVIRAISSSYASQPGEIETTFTYFFVILPALVVAALLAPCPSLS